MKLYRISCYSSCGSYFSSYLQSILVLAESKEDAVKLAILTEVEFIKDNKSWEVELVTDDFSQSKIIQYDYNSDY